MNNFLSISMVFKYPFFCRMLFTVTGRLLENICPRKNKVYNYVLKIFWTTMSKCRNFWTK